LSAEIVATDSRNTGAKGRSEEDDAGGELHSND
jgi:hypothetical protein